MLCQGSDRTFLFHRPLLNRGRANVADEHTLVSWCELWNRASCLSFSPNAAQLHHLTWIRGKTVG